MRPDKDCQELGSEAASLSLQSAQGFPAVKDGVDAVKRPVEIDDDLIAESTVAIENLAAPV